MLVFIHGESWSWGSSSLYDARVLATLGQIIVVTFNYRIGIFGFLNTNPSPMTKGHVANYGLVDQMAALQWVVEDIKQFGGDPGRITVMGQVGAVRSITPEIAITPKTLLVFKPFVFCAIMTV